MCQCRPILSFKKRKKPIIKEEKYTHADKEYSHEKQKRQDYKSKILSKSGSNQQCR
jgi:hypothetical protein